METKQIKSKGLNYKRINKIIFQNKYITLKVNSIKYIETSIGKDFNDININDLLKFILSN